MTLACAFPALIETIHHHFNSEKKICKQLGLNFTEEHRQHHAYILHSLKEIDIKESESNTYQNILTFIKLLEEHIKKHDRKLAPNTQ